MIYRLTDNGRPRLTKAPLELLLRAVRAAGSEGRSVRLEEAESRRLVVAVDPAGSTPG